MISLGLSRITQLLHSIKSPHLVTPIVHIAGTNGKGSVSAYLASILHTANLRVGRFNSPHLVDEWDCVRIEENVVQEQVFRAAKEEIQRSNKKEGLEATPFEILTATAYSLFARANLDLAVVEVGMGGEGDATNVVPASKTLLSILTAVDLDHQGFLGNTVAAIAKVKSGIVRNGGDLVVAKQVHPEVVQVAKDVSRERGATVWQAQAGSPSPSPTASGGSLTASLPLSPASVHPPNDLSFPSTNLLANLPLPGSYQLDNSAVALLAAQLLRILPRTTQLLPLLGSISDEALREGIERTRWDGRLQWIDLSRSTPARIASASEPLGSSSTASNRFLLDGAHNPSSANLLASYLSTLPPSLPRPATLIFGLSALRPAADVLRPLLTTSTRIEKVVCVEFSPPVGMPWVRATPAVELAQAVRDMGVDGVTVETSDDLGSAISEEYENGKTAVIAGSLYLVADALRIARRNES